MTAGLDAYVDMREGDVFETVAELDGTFDMVFFDVWADAYLRLFKQIERLLRRDRSYWPTTCTQPRTPFDRTSTTSITTRGFRPRPWTLNRESNLRSSFIEWRCRRCGSSMGSRAKEHRRHPAPRSISAAQMQNPAFRAGFLGSLTITYFHTGIRTIIGVESFHGPVRDGKGWDRLAMVIRQRGLLCWLRSTTNPEEAVILSCVYHTRESTNPTRSVARNRLVIGSSLTGN